LREHGSVVAGCASRLGVILLSLTLAAAPAAAARHPVRHLHFALTDPSVIGESILVDAATGRVLSESNADLQTHPASLTKMMTLYLTFSALNEGRLRLEQYLPVSAEASAQSPTKLGLNAGDSVQVRDLILGIVTRSANDAAVVLAEGLAGSVPAFAQRMNQEAQRLGMSQTHFVNPSGLPDPEQQTTARDMARLALALIHDFPREYGYFSTREFEFRGAMIRGHDHLLDWYQGADGIKTGYIRTSGFNLATSAVRDGHRLIGIVLGGRTASARDDQMAQLLDAGFAQLGVTPTVAVATAPPPPVRPAVATAAEASVPATRPDALARAAARLAAHFAPVSGAEAAPLAHGAPAKDRWSVQLGAYKAPAAAEKAGREAAGLSLAKSKPLQILHPGAGKDRLYRARLLDFSPAQARAVCAELKAKGVECTVVRPAKAATRS
jgi:D-alanyl-D-alanine carboxypeptidase